MRQDDAVEVCTFALPRHSVHYCLSTGEAYRQERTASTEGEYLAVTDSAKWLNFKQVSAFSASTWVANVLAISKTMECQTDFWEGKLRTGSDERAQH